MRHDVNLGRRSVGKVAERIVMNELEARGYRVTDLNKDGLSANADLIAAKGGKIWQIQVRGSTNTMGKRWWKQHGVKDYIDSWGKLSPAENAALEAHPPTPEQTQQFITALEALLPEK